MRLPDYAILSGESPRFLPWTSVFFLLVSNSPTTFYKFVYIWTCKCKYNMIGEKLRELRESKGLVQREVAPKLKIDTAYFSKIENNEKRLQRAHIPVLAKIYGVKESELLTLWFAQKIISTIENEVFAIPAIELALTYLKSNKPQSR